MIEFFAVEDVLEFHKEQIDLYGGSHGVRDRGLLEAALAMPSSGFGSHFFHAFPFEMAAAYLFHIVQNHPFIDGNKRTGLATCLFFLALHGLQIEVDVNELEQFVRAVAAGEIGKTEIARFLRIHAQNFPSMRLD